MMFYILPDADKYPGFFICIVILRNPGTCLHLVTHTIQNVF